MAIAKGFRATAGLRPSTTWGTAVAVGAGHGIEMISESFERKTAEIVDDQITGAVAGRESDAGNVTVSGDFKTALRYEGNEILIAQPFGTAGTPTLSDTTAQTHVFKLNTDMESIMSTLVVDRRVALFEFVSVKWTKLMLDAQIGKRVELTASGIGWDRNIGSTTIVNTPTAYASLTYPSNRLFALFKHMVVRVNAQSGGALASTDAIYVSGFSVTLDRTFKADDYTTEYGNRISAPSEIDHVKVTGSIRFSKYHDGTGGGAALLAAHDPLTRYKMDVKFTSTTLAGAASAYYAHNLYFPNIQFTEPSGPVTAGKGVEEHTLNFHATRVTSAPTGFTSGYTDPIVWENVSQRSVDALSTT